MALRCSCGRTSAHGAMGRWIDCWWWTHWAISFFQQVLHNWCNKSHGMCSPVYWMVHIKHQKSSLWSGCCGFPLSEPYLWCFFQPWCCSACDPTEPGSVVLHWLQRQHASTESVEGGKIWTGIHTVNPHCGPVILNNCLWGAYHQIKSPITDTWNVSIYLHIMDQNTTVSHLWNKSQKMGVCVCVCVQLLISELQEATRVCLPSST